MSQEGVAPVVLLLLRLPRTQHQHNNDHDLHQHQQDTLHGHGQRTPGSKEVVAPVVLLPRQLQQLQQQRPLQQAPISMWEPTSRCLARALRAPLHHHHQQTRLWSTCHHGFTCPPSRLWASRRCTGRARHGHHSLHRHRRLYHSRHDLRSCRCSETADLLTRLSPQAVMPCGFISGSAG